MLYQIVYLSSTPNALETEELIGILNESREKNRVNNITGMLMYCGGSFLQVIEGEKDKVCALFDKIRHDARHIGIYKVCESDLNQRNFTGWTMGFRSLSPEQLQEKTGCRSLLELVTAANCREEGHPCVMFLKSLITEKQGQQSAQPALAWISRISGVF